MTGKSTSTPRSQRKNLSNKTTTIQIVNSGVQRRSNCSPKKIWQNANEHDQSKLLKDNMEQEIRKSRQVRRSAEIDMQLEKHYVPARTKNFLFIQRSPGQVMDKTVLEKTDLKSIGLTQKETEKKNLGKLTKSTDRDMQKEVDDPSCVKNSKSDCERTPELHSLSSRHILRSGINDSPNIEEGKTEKEADRSPAQNQIMQTCLVRRKFTQVAGKSPDKGSTTENSRDSVLKRRLRSPKKINFPEGSKECSETQRDSQDVLVKSPRRSLRGRIAVNNEASSAESVNVGIDVTSSVDVDVDSPGDNLRNSIDEQLKVSLSSNCASPQKKTKNEDQKLDTCKSRTRNSMKTKQQDLNKIEQSEVGSDCPEIESDQEKGQIRDVKPDQENVESFPHLSKDAEEQPKCQKIETSVDRKKQKAEEADPMKETDDKMVKDVVRSSKMLRSSKRYDTKDTSIENCELKHPKNSVKSVVGTTDSKTSQQESPKKRSSTRKIGVSHGASNNAVLDVSFKENPESCASGLRDEETASLSFECTENKVISPVKQRVLRSRTSLKNDCTEDIKRDLPTEESKQETLPEDVDDNTTKNGSHTQPSPCKGLHSVAEVLKATNGSPASQNSSATNPLSMEILEDSSDAGKLIDAEVEKSLFYIDRVHRLRCTNQRQTIVDRELKDITSKVKERHPDSNSPSLREMGRETGESTTPVHDSLRKSCVETPKVISSDAEQRTPKITSPRSGLSNTPRSTKRMRWSQRRESKSSEVKQSTSKVKRLDKLKYPVDTAKSPEKLPTGGSNRILGNSKTSNKAAPQSDKDLMGSADSVVRSDHTPSKRKIKAEPVLQGEGKDNFKSPMKSPKIKSPLKRVKCVTPHKFSSPLVWKNAKGSTPKGRKRIKLNNSWSVLSDRSVNKLLHDSDSESNFEGFDEGDLAGHSSLCSDASFVEINEVELEENSNQEWEIDQGKGGENEDEDGVILPEIFSSPGKRSDSSWDTGFVDFIDTHFSHRQQSSHPDGALAEAVGSPRRRKRLESNPENCTEKRLHRTDKRRRLGEGEEFQCYMVGNGAAQVDEEIQFNFSSPNKRKTKGSKGHKSSGAKKKCIYYGSPEKRRVLEENDPNSSRCLERKEAVQLLDKSENKNVKKSQPLRKSSNERNSKQFVDTVDMKPGLKSDIGGASLNNSENMPVLSPQGTRRSSGLAKPGSSDSPNIPNLSPQPQKNDLSNSAHPKKYLRSRKP